MNKSFLILQQSAKIINKRGGNKNGKVQKNDYLDIEIYTFTSTLFGNCNIISDVSWIQKSNGKIIILFFVSHEKLQQTTGICSQGNKQ